MSKPKGHFSSPALLERARDFRHPLTPPEAKAWYGASLPLLQLATADLIAGCKDRVTRMELTFDNFTEVIDPAILLRGFEYYEDGQVISIQSPKSGLWRAEVQGTELYRVELERDEEGSLLHECSCPYDSGPVCKHIAAVLYGIVEGLPEDEDEPDERAGQSRPHPHDMLRSLLETAPREELVKVLIERAREDPGLANQLRLRFESAGVSRKTITRMVRQALKEGQDRHGFLDYWGALTAARAVEGILDQAENRLSQGNGLGAASIFQAVLETVVAAMGDADDSTGSLASCIQHALEGLQHAREAMSPDQRAALFEYCLETAPSQLFAGWDWGWQLAELGAAWIRSPAQRRRLFDTLDRMASSDMRLTGVTGLFDQIEQERCAEIKLSVIEREGDVAAVQAFLEAHTSLPEMRERLARFLIARGDLDTAKRLCNDWLEQSAVRAPGLRKVFLGILLEIAETERDDSARAGLARALFVDTGKFDYYDLLKKSLPGEAWEVTLESLIGEAENNSYVRSLVPEIYIREEMWDRLLKVARRGGPHLLLGHREHLEPRFPAEMCFEYERIVYAALAHASNRGTYQNASLLLQRMGRLGAVPRALEMIEELIAKHRNRRAMVEELTLAAKALRLGLSGGGR